MQDASAPSVTQPNLGFGATNGTLIRPGAGQTVQFGWFHRGPMGDTDDAESCLIDTAHATGTVINNEFVDTWCATSLSADGVSINNTAGGTVNGNHFIGLRAENNYGNGVRVHAGATVAGAPSVIGTEFDASHFCGNNRQNVYVSAGTWTGLAVDNGVDATHPLKVAVRSSTSSSTCDGQPLSDLQFIGLSFGNFNEIIATNNDLCGNTVPINGSSLVANSIIAHNKCLDGAAGTMASGTTATLPASLTPIVLVTGTTSTQNLLGGWLGRVVTLYSQDGSVPYATGGTATTTFCNSKTVAIGATVTATYVPGPLCWSLN